MVRVAASRCAVRGGGAVLSGVRFKRAKRRSVAFGRFSVLAAMLAGFAMLSRAAAASGQN
jgi:hypothetical protein